MRSPLWLMLLVVGLVELGRSADTTPSPADKKATEDAKKAYVTALDAENAAQKTLFEKLDEYKKCNEDLAALKTRQADFQAIQDLIIKAQANIIGKTTALNNKNAPDVAIVNQDLRDEALDGAVSDKLSDFGLKITDKTKACTTLKDNAQTGIPGAQTAYVAKKKETEAKKKDLEEKAKKAPLEAPKPAATGGTATGAITPEQQAAIDKQKKSREATDKVTQLFKAVTECPTKKAAAEANAKIFDYYVAKFNAWKATLQASANTRDQTAITDDMIKTVNGLKDKANKAPTDIKTECDKANTDLETAKKEVEKAKEEAEYAQKIADNPSLATTVAGGAAAATAASGATTAATGSTVSGASTVSGTTTAAPSGSKKDEGPDATINVDGAPLEPSTPCCMKANAGLCKVSELIRNMCNTECGCEKAKGTCTGNPPKKCTKDGSGKVAGQSADPPKELKCADDGDGDSSRAASCPGWAAAKKCGIKEGYWMQHHCTKSCNMCGKNDIEEYHCWGWAFLGECNGSSKDWMNKFCSLSCDNLSANPMSLSMAQRRKIVARKARARTLSRRKEARLSAVAKIKRNRAKAARRASLAKKAGSRAFIKASAARRRRLRIAKARAQARKSRTLN